jgi:hypothetical protein
MPTKVKDRPVHAKGPEACPGPCLTFWLEVCCASQAVAVRNFLIVISSFARNQSSSS